mgnify:CR=1 FL=1
MGEVKADGAHGGEAQLALLFDRVGGVETLARAAGEAGFLRGQRLGHEALEEALEIGKERIELDGAVARIVLIHQGVIGGQASGSGAQLRLLAHQSDDAFERGQEAVPVALGTQLAPELFGAHGGGGLALDEFGGQAGGADILALELGQSQALVLAFGPGGLDPVGDYGGGGLGMIHAGQVGHGLGALVAATDCHMRGFVGPQNG